LDQVREYILPDVLWLADWQWLLPFGARLRSCRSLRKFKISTSKFATILSERSKMDGVTTPPGRCLIGFWRQGNRSILAKHHEGLVSWLAEMKEHEEEEEDEEEDEEDEEEGG
jgi:hypothetical protein